MGFNESTDLVGAPVETSHGNGIVRSIGTPSSGSTTSAGSSSSNDISSSAPANSRLLPPPLSPPILVVELEDTSAYPTKNGGSNSNGSARDVSSDADVDALTNSTSSPPPLPAQPAQPPPPPQAKSQAPRRIVRVTPDQLLRRPPVCSPGTCVETTLGTGVLVSFRPGDDMHVVRLWKPRGAGSALAYLNRASMLRRLPAAVGIRVATPEGEGVVVGLMGGGGGKADVFLVELAAGGATVLIDGESISSPVAKVTDEFNDVFGARPQGTEGHLVEFLARTIG